MDGPQHSLELFFVALSPSLPPPVAFVYAALLPLRAATWNECGQWRDSSQETTAIPKQT